MMSSAGTSRASRSSKDKTVKIQTTQNVKSEGPPKNQPTAEQMRLAQMIADNDIEDPVIQAKVNQVMELTGRGKDDVIVALHDCDQDPNRAINMLLEGEDHQQGEWQESTKRKKGKAQLPSGKGDGTPNHTDTREKSRDRDDYNARDSGPPRDRERRGRQPPRLARKNREREENERNAQRNQRQMGEGDDGEVRERSYERGRGRGRGQVNGSGGRGRGRGGRGYRSSRYDNGPQMDTYKGPQIDTWTNETAENAEKENNSWGEMGEEWGTDEWTGSLEETKVFTASSIGDQPPKGFSSTVGDNDAKMFTAPAMQVDSQVFSSNLTIENSNQSALNDATNSIGQNSISQNTLGQSSHPLGQRLDLGLLLQKPSADSQPTTSQAQSQFMSQFSKQTTESLKNAMGVGSQNQQQAQYMSQFSKEATDTIKSMMGIGTTTSSHQPPASVASPVARPPMTSQTTPQQAAQQTQQQTAPQQAPTQQQSQQQTVQQTQQQQQQQSQSMTQQRAKPQRSKLPPPSKIPASAVEMPGHGGPFQLDVQFGNWDFAPSESSGFSFGSRTDVTSSYSTPISTTTTSSAQGNHLPQEPKSTSDAAPSQISPAIAQNVPSAVTSANSKPAHNMSGLDNMSTQSADRSPRSNVFQNSTSPATTPNKDYSQSRLDQSRKMTPPDPIPFPTDRKTSPHFSQRSSHSSSGMNSSKSGTSPSQTSYSQNYTSNYPSSGYQSNSKSPSSGYNSHQSSSLSGSNLTSGMQNQMSGNTPSQYSSHQSHSGYPSSSSTFQSQSAFSNQGQNSLYQSSSQGGGGSSAYSSQSPTTYQSSSSSGYQSQSGPGGYQSQSSSSYHGRDNQSSSSSYQPSVSQSGNSSHYQTSSGSQSSSSYQRDSQPNQSGYQSYGSSSHQNSLQSSSMTMSTTKLSDSLSKVSMKDPSSIDSHTSQQNSYEHSSSTTTPTITAATTTTASPSGGNVSVTSALGLATATTVTTTSKTSNLPVTSKAPPNLPPGVPLIGHNYMMQPGMTFAPFGLAQQPVYSYEDLQLLQQRLPLHGYYDMPLQPPTTLTGREQGNLANVPYTGADGKIGRVDAQSPVQAQTSQQGQNQSGHQQTYMNPTIPPGYNYYYPGGMLPSTPYSYTTPMFPVPAVTNAAHGGTTANAQFQKPGAYGSHAYNTAGYDDLGSQTQDFTKYGGASQSQSKAPAGGTVSSNATDLSGSTYGKAHTQSFDKANFHAATPPPFNMPLSTGTQAGPMAPSAYGAPYVPMMPHQAHSQMLHPHMQQDTTGGSSRGSQPNNSQPKPGANKPYSGGYWSTN